MTTMNSAMKETAACNIEEFKNAIAKNIVKYGAGWEDIIIYFEWHNKRVSMLESQSALSAHIDAVLDKYPELYGTFDGSTLEQAAAKNVQDAEGLAMFIREQMSQYKITKVNKRF